MNILLNGRLLQAENALVSTRDRGFRYGDGIFETLRVVGGVPWRFAWHKNRLAGGLSAIRIEYDLSTLETQCLHLLTANRVQDGLLRIQITRGEGGRGYLPEPCEPTCLMEIFPLPPVPKESVRLWLSDRRRPTAEMLPTRYKLCQGLNSTLARMEAADHGCFDALQLSASGELCETSSANLFWLKEGILYTPSLACDVTEGAVRDAILSCGLYPVQEARVGIAELKNAEAVFVTNISWLALPVASLDPTGFHWNSAPTTAEISQRLQKMMTADSQLHKAAWVR